MFTVNSVSNDEVLLSVALPYTHSHTPFPDPGNSFPGLLLVYCQKGIVYISAIEFLETNKAVRQLIKFRKITL